MKVGSGPHPPSPRSAHPGPLSCPLLGGTGEAIRIPLIAFFLTGAFLSSKRPLMPPLSRN